MRIRVCLDDGHIRRHSPFVLDDDQSILSQSGVSWAKSWLKQLVDMGHETLMKAWPDRSSGKPGIHARKRTQHRVTSNRTQFLQVATCRLVESPLPSAGLKRPSSLWCQGNHTTERGVMTCGEVTSIWLGTDNRVKVECALALEVASPVRARGSACENCFWLSI